MSHPFTQPSSKELLRRVAQQFTSGNTFVQRSSHIVFVCGGSAAKDMRPRFLSYAADGLPHLRTFLAEIAQKDYVTHPEPAFHNIAEFEDIIGEVSDCVVLFPESPGSYAELGYFAKNEELRKKLLVVNRTDLQGQDSFIALGPIELIDRHSNFRPAIQLQYKKNPQFHLIKERIEKRIPAGTRRRFTHTKFAELTTQEQLFVIFEIINLFQAITIDGIEYAFRSIFGNANPENIKRFLSILVAADFVQRCGGDNEFFGVNRTAKPFFEFEGWNTVTFRLELVDFYEKHFPNIAAIVKDLPQ